jgi:prepilin-type N-terminal cleavage/methylation domain-containing protein
MTRGSKPGRQSGMTLVEIAIVLAILGLLAAVSLPSFLGWKEASELRSAAVEVSDVMLSSRTKAVLERRNYTVQVNYTTNTYTVTPTGGRVGAAWGTVDLYADDSDPDCPALSAGNILFRPDGTADAAGFEAVYLRSTSSRVPERYRVTVLGATGKVGLEKWRGGTWSGAY